MTQVIDHAIQIPVSPSNMWALVSNPENNTRWQTNCRSLSFLNSIRRGIGMRWRYENGSGKSYVAEVTAWYEGLGFEYTLVDGTQFQSNKGRIRLQEVPEGTIVQWTFSYEMSGMLAGLRNTLATRRSLDTQVVESLRNLFRVAKDVYHETNLKDSKALMREAPNVQERSSYKPRYRSVLEDGKPGPTTATPSSEIRAVRVPTPPAEDLYQRPVIEEPPIALDDTRPNQVLRQTAEMAAVPPPLPAVEESNEREDAYQPSRPEPIVPANPELILPAIPPVDTPPPAAVAEPEPTTPAPIGMRIDPSTLDKRDTATISVFELFGLPRPSNTQEMAAVTIESPAPLPTTTEPAPSVPVSDVSSSTPPVETSTAETPPSAEIPLVIVTPTVMEAPAIVNTPVVEMPPMVEQVVIEVDDLPQAAVVTADFTPISDQLAKDAFTVPVTLSVDTMDAAFTDRITADVIYALPRVGLRRRLRRQLVRLRSTS